MIFEVLIQSRERKTISVLDSFSVMYFRESDLSRTGGIQREINDRSIEEKDWKRNRIPGTGMKNQT